MTKADLVKELNEKKNILKAVPGYEHIFTPEYIANNKEFYTKSQGIYIWQSIDNFKNNKNIFKVGQYGDMYGNKRPQDTIADYNAALSNDVVIVYAQECDNAKTKEIAIHKELTMMGYRYDSGSSTETYHRISLDKILSVISKHLHQDKIRTLSYDPRPEQEDAAHKMREWYKTEDPNFLLAAKMRFGKNFTFLYLIKLLNDENLLKHKNILVSTYRPKVYESLFNDINNHILFKDFEISKIKENVTEKKDKIQIFFSSAQYALNKKNTEKISEKDYDLLIIDEYHYGTSTINFKCLLDRINVNKIIWCSGTAFKDIVLKTYDESNSFHWTYIDEQKEKRKEIESGLPNGSHMNMPTMEMHTIKISDVIKDILHSDYNVDIGESFTMTQLFEYDRETQKFVYPGAVEKFLKIVIGNDFSKNKNLSPFNIGENINHSYWILPSNVDMINSLSKMMGNMKEYEDFNILTATGKGNTLTVDKLNEKINTAEKNNRKTITLSCGMFKEGTTVKHWKATFFLDDGKSPEGYWQAAFRPGSPMEGKDIIYVFDFNPQRCLLKIYNSTEAESVSNNKTTLDIIKERIDYCPIILHETNGFIKVDVEEVIKTYSDVTNITERFKSDLMFNISKLNDNTREMFLGMDSPKNMKNRKFESLINDNDIPIGKISNITIIKNEGENNKNDKDINYLIKEKRKKEKQLKEKLRNILSNIPMFIFISDENISNLNELLKTKQTEDFKTLMKMSVEDFKEIFVDTGLLVIKIFNSKMLDLHMLLDKIDKNAEYLSPSQKLELFNKEIGGNGVMGSTPQAIINKQLAYFADDFWENPNLKILDPCCGNGTYLAVIFNKLDKALENVIYNKEERHNHIINNMLYGNDNDETKIKFVRKILNIKNLTNIDVKKINKSKYKDMKFDLIISNPPYKKNLHLKILNEVKDLSDKICFVHPSTWLYDNKDTFKMFVETKENFKDRFAHFEVVENANELFGIGSFVPIIISVFDKNNKVLLDIHDIDIHGDSIVYKSMKSKILDYCKVSNVYDNIQKNKNKYEVGIAAVRGHVDDPDFYTMIQKTNEAMHIGSETKYEVGIATVRGNVDDPDFYTMTQKANEAMYIGNENKYDIKFYFNTKKEAINFKDYLKTKMARFCLSIYKINQMLDRGELNSVPYLPTYEHNWTDEMVAKEIGLSDEELEWAINYIPDYYPEDKEIYLKYKKH